MSINDRPATRGMRPCFFILSLMIATLSSGVSLAQPVCEDRDGDGYESGSTCDTDRDCQDLYLPINPGAAETCNGLDDDCSGTPDEPCPGICATREAFQFASAPDVSGDPDHFPGQPQIVRLPGGYGVSWRWRVTNPDGSANTCVEYRLARLDEAGRVVSGPTRIVGGPGLRSYTGGRTDLAWTGRELWFAADDGPVTACDGTAPPFLAFIRRVDLDGTVVGPPIVPDCEAGGGPLSSVYSLVWTGSRMAVIYETSGLRAGVYGRLYSADGDPLTGCIPIDLSGPGGGSWAWNGHHFGRAFAKVPEDEPPPRLNSELYFERFDENLMPLDSEPQRITFNPETSGAPQNALAWTGEHWAIAFEDRYPAPGANIDVAVALVTPDRQLVDPPGIIWVTRSDLNDSQAYRIPGLVWNGHELAVFYLDPAPASQRGEIFMARVSAAGEHLPPDVLVTNDPFETSASFESVWNGSEYATAISYGRQQDFKNEIRLQRTGCECADADGDLFSTCRGQDCADANPLANPLAREVCGNGVDDDCDGLPDCLDVADCPPSAAVPTEVTQLVVQADGATISWSPVAGATRYDLVRGRIWDLPYQRYRTAACVASDVPGTTATDAATPILGDGFYYLVRAEAGAPSSCLVSTWGSAERDGDIAGCP